VSPDEVAESDTAGFRQKYFKVKYFAKVI